MDRSPHFSGLWQDDERAALLDAIQTLADRPHSGSLRGPDWTFHRYESGAHAVFAASHRSATRMLTATTADELALRLRGYGQSPVEEALIPLALAA